MFYMNHILERIVNTVAEAEDKDPTALPPLYESIDPDAINRLIESQSADSEMTCVVRFEYSDHEITVDETGAVTLTPDGGTRPELRD